MRKYLDENSTINTIRLELRHPASKNCLWILVEGITDQKLYSKLIDGSNTKVEMVHGGVENLRNAASILVLETNQVLAIRDADFLHLNNKQETISCLFLTDVHDGEMMLLSCDSVFESIVAEYIPSKRTHFKKIRDEVLSSLVFLGGIRWLNNTENLELNFKGLSLDNFYNANSLTLCKAECIQEIEKRSPNKNRSINTEEIDLKIANISDHYNLCNGHDFEKAFAQHANSVNQGTGAKGIKDSDIGKAMRLTYRKEDFQATKLYSCLKNWEVQTGYALFLIAA
jgi:Protein of unknown function (DUF4435)